MSWGVQENKPKLSNIENIIIAVFFIFVELKFDNSVAVRVITQSALLQGNTVWFEEKSLRLEKNGVLK